MEITCGKRDWSRTLKNSNIRERPLENEEDNWLSAVTRAQGVSKKKKKERKKFLILLSSGGIRTETHLLTLTTSLVTLTKPNFEGLRKMYKVGSI